MRGMLLAKSAILIHFDTIRRIFLVLHGVVIALLAFGACQSNFYSHIMLHLPHKKRLLLRSTAIISQTPVLVNTFLKKL